MFEVTTISLFSVNYFLVLGIRLQTGRCVCVSEIKVCFILVVSVRENYNSLSVYRVGGPFVQTNYTYIENFWRGERHLNTVNQLGQPQKRREQTLKIQ